MPEWTNSNAPRSPQPGDKLKIVVSICIGAAVFLVGHYVFRIW
jgi:hypothetical protein